MADINATIPLLEPLAATFQSLIGIIQLIVGGIFGLYVIMFVVRIYYYVKFHKLFSGFKEELGQLSKKVDSMGRKLDRIKGRGK